MIERKTRYISDGDFRKWFKEKYGTELKEVSGEYLVQILFETWEGRPDFKVVDPWYRPDKKWWHRLNHFWAYPLTLLCGPFQYVVKGEMGWSDNTRFGSWLLRVTGYR